MNILLFDNQQKPQNTQLQQDVSLSEGWTPAGRSQNTQLQQDVSLSEGWTPAGRPQSAQLQQDVNLSEGCCLSVSVNRLRLGYLYVLPGIGKMIMAI